MRYICNFSIGNIFLSYFSARAGYHYASIMTNFLTFIVCVYRYEAALGLFVRNVRIGE